jgi:hypothetical protein
MKRLATLPALLLSAVFCAAGDFGLNLTEEFESSGGGGGTVLAWTQTAVPWFRLAPSDGFSLYLSADFCLEYADGGAVDSGPWRPLFRPNRSFILWKPAAAFFAEAGRLWYQDPLGLIAQGLFDGARLTLNMGQHTLEASALYAGLQHKDAAKIIMTQGDLTGYLEDGSYFAPRRLLASLFWQARQAGLGSVLDLGGLAQFDLRDSGGEKLNSQYGLGKFTLTLAKVFDLSLGGVIGAKQQDSGNALSLAGNLSAAWALPGPPVDRLVLEAYVSSGGGDKGLVPFFPVSSISAGNVFTPGQTGLATATARYRISPHTTLYLELMGVYFWRTTTDIIPGVAALPRKGDTDRKDMGAELYLSAAWRPFSDLGFTLGGGVFLPSGPVGDAGMETTWQIKAATTLSL